MFNMEKLNVKTKIESMQSICLHILAVKPIFFLL